MIAIMPTLDAGSRSALVIARESDRPARLAPASALVAKQSRDGPPR
jgi:hypothetical protein